MLSAAGIDKAREVMEVTMGRAKADLVITNGTLLNVYTGELLPGQNVAIKGEWIAYVGPEGEERIGSTTKVIDARQKVMVQDLSTAMHTLRMAFPSQVNFSDMPSRAAPQPL
jgi:adenine deaminase